MALVMAPHEISKQKSTTIIFNKIGIKIATPKSFVLLNNNKKAPNNCDNPMNKI